MSKLSRLQQLVLAMFAVDFNRVIWDGTEIIALHTGSNEEFVRSEHVLGSKTELAFLALENHCHRNKVKPTRWEFKVVTGTQRKLRREFYHRNDGCPSKPPCFNYQMRFNCSCEWIKKHPGNIKYSCEWHGLYEAGKPHCNKCEVSA